MAFLPNLIFAQKSLSSEYQVGLRQHVSRALVLNENSHVTILPKY
jgi:hypothetical protein